MGNCAAAIDATYDGRTSTLHVECTIQVMGSPATVRLEPAPSPGINPTILLLNLVVEDSGPMKPQPATAKYAEQGIPDDKYKQVQIISEWRNLDCTIGIDYIG